MNSKFDALRDRFVNGESVEAACRSVHACKANEDESKKQNLGVMGNVAQSLITTFRNEVSSKDTSQLDLGCILCQYTGQVIEQVVQFDKMFLPLLKEGIQTMCTYLPPEAQVNSM